MKTLTWGVLTAVIIASWSALPRSAAADLCSAQAANMQLNQSFCKPGSHGIGLSGDIFPPKDVVVGPAGYTTFLSYTIGVPEPLGQNGTDGIAAWAFNFEGRVTIKIPSKVPASFLLAMILNVSDQNAMMGSSGSTVESDLTILPSDAGAYKTMSVFFDGDNIPAHDPLTATIYFVNDSTTVSPVIKSAGAAPAPEGSLGGGPASGLAIRMWNN